MRLLGHVLYWLRRLADPPEFVVGFDANGPRVARGKLPARWLADVAAVATDFGIRSGHVDGYRRAGLLQLRFSPAIPRASHQRFRNVIGAAWHANR